MNTSFLQDNSILTLWQLKESLENAITSYTREEYMGIKITRTCIDHDVVRVSNIQKKLGGVMKQKWQIITLLP